MLPGFEELRNQLIAKRKEAGLTQAEIAEKANVSQSFVAKVEKGRSTPNYDDVSRLYNTLEELLNGGSNSAVNVMTSYIVSVTPSDTVRHASSIMRSENYTQLPVLNNGTNEGTVTNRTLLNADPNDAVNDHIEPPLPEVPENTSKQALSELLKTNDAVLVRRDKEIVGIVTAADMI